MAEEKKTPESTEKKAAPKKAAPKKAAPKPAPKPAQKPAPVVEPAQKSAPVVEAAPKPAQKPAPVVEAAPPAEPHVFGLLDVGQRVRGLHGDGVVVSKGTHLGNLELGQRSIVKRDDGTSYSSWDTNLKVWLSGFLVDPFSVEK